jgi:hypothetical protein
MTAISQGRGQLNQVPGPGRSKEQACLHPFRSAKKLAGDYNVEAFAVARLEEDNTTRVVTQAGSGAVQQSPDCRWTL